MSIFSYKAMEIAIVSAIKGTLGGASDTLPIFFPNAPQTAPQASETRPASYIAVSIIHGTPSQVDTGAALKRHRRPGVLQISIYTQLGKGTKRTADIVDDIVATFRGSTVQASGGSIVFENCGPRPGSREGAYWRVDVDSRFYSDDFDS